MTESKASDLKATGYGYLTDAERKAAIEAHSKAAK
jgi:hypothetical protein